MNKEIVTIESVDKFGVTYTNGIEASRKNFPGVKPGQKWEVITKNHDDEFPNSIFPLGIIVSTRLVTDVP